jgi:hypothetical protein
MFVVVGKMSCQGEYRCPQDGCRVTTTPPGRPAVAHYYQKSTQNGKKGGETVKMMRKNETERKQVK